TTLSSDRRNGHLLSILKYPKFYLICFSFSIVYMNMTTYLSNVIDLAKDRNVDDWNAVLLVTIYAVGDLSARLVSGIITDKGFMQKSSMMAASFVLWTAVMSLAPFCSSYHLHVIVSLASGWCTGTTVVLIPVIFMEIVHQPSLANL
ncbi:monocarboxylate transporter, putative, partial [Ixodes scapularis]